MLILNVLKVTFKYFCFFYLLLTLSGDAGVFTLLYRGLVFQVDLHLATVSPVVQDDLQGEGQW